MEYIKTIRMEDGWVHAYIHRRDGTQIDKKYWLPPWFRTSSACDKQFKYAPKWADDLITVLKDKEFNS